MIFDTHTHFNDEQLINNIDEDIKKAKLNNIVKFLCVGYDVESSVKAVKIANKHEEVYAAVGIIPTEWKKYDDDTINKIREIARSSKKVIAIGEIGLDYYWENAEEIKKIQKEMFIRQIELANELDLPISIHARDSLQDVLDILKIHKVNNSGIMHCYSGSLELAKEFIKLGFYIAFGGVLTFKNSVKTKEIIKNIDINKVVFETDAPYLSPEPFRGRTNHVERIVETVKYASNLLNIEQSELERITFDNSLKSLHVKTYEE